jgi:hypothetical protein
MLGAVREATLALSYESTFVITLKHLKESERARADLDMALSLTREFSSCHCSTGSRISLIGRANAVGNSVTTLDMHLFRSPAKSAKK